MHEEFNVHLDVYSLQHYKSFYSFIEKINSLLLWQRGVFLRGK
jgi:hypothetical protein